jgi:hypothetical protein
MNASGWSVAEVLSDGSNRPYQGADAGVTGVESGHRWWRSPTKPVVGGRGRVVVRWVETRVVGIVDVIADRVLAKSRWA